MCDHVGILSRGKVLIERSLSALQENVVKMQVVFQEKELPQLPGDLQVLHVSQVGRIHTLIIRGNATEITNRLAAFAPILMEALPLTLEEIFIYELGGEDYAVRDIVLLILPCCARISPASGPSGRCTACSGWRCCPSIFCPTGYIGTGEWPAACP